MGSPPPAGSKKVVLKFRSVKSIVIAPARTGNARSNSTAVNKTLHTNRGMYGLLRILAIVVIKLIEPKILLTPAKCREKMDKSTDGSLCPIVDKGGYTVHPVPLPAPTNLEANRRNNEGGNNQNLTLFKRGKAISGAFKNKFGQYPSCPDPICLIWADRMTFPTLSSSSHTFLELEIFAHQKKE